MARNWHYIRGNQQAGPLSAAELRQLATSGQLSPTDMVWTEGMSAWVPAEKVKGLWA
jgi:hypothetical protein